MVYRLVLPSARRLAITLCSSRTNFDTHLEVYSGCPCEAGGLNLCGANTTDGTPTKGWVNNDDGPSCIATNYEFPPSKIRSMEFPAGEHYIKVRGLRAGSFGSYGISIQLEDAAQVCA